MCKNQSPREKSSISNSVLIRQFFSLPLPHLLVSAWEKKVASLCVHRQEIQLTFNVPVNNAVLMQVVDSQDNLPGVASDEILWKPHLGRLLYRTSVTVLHEHQHLILWSRKQLHQASESWSSESTQLLPMCYWMIEHQHLILWGRKQFYQLSQSWSSLALFLSPPLSHACTRLLLECFAWSVSKRLFATAWEFWVSYICSSHQLNKIFKCASVQFTYISKMHFWSAILVLAALLLHPPPPQKHTHKVESCDRAQACSVSCGTSTQAMGCVGGIPTVMWSLWTGFWKTPNHQVQSVNRLLKYSNRHVQSMNRLLKVSNHHMQFMSSLLKVSNHCMQSMNRLLKVSNHRTQSKNRLLKVSNRHVQSMNRLLKVSNRHVQSMNRLLKVSNHRTQSMNRLLKVSNHHTQSMNRLLKVSNRHVQSMYRLLKVSNRHVQSMYRLLKVSNRHVQSTNSFWKFLQTKVGLGPTFSSLSTVS